MTGFAMLACGASACRAHTQDLALDRAAIEFSDGKDPVCASVKLPGSSVSADSQNSAASLAREKLEPWIVGPNQYVIEGCNHQARYTCDSDACRRDGVIEPLHAFVESPASGADVARFEAAGARPSADPAAPTPAPGPDAPADNADAAAVRTTLDAHRSELASCVEKTPFGVKVDYAPGAPLAAALRGDLHGKPEEACVRDVLKGVGALPLKSAGMLIHVVK
jgi:hypothetical protein